MQRIPSRLQVIIVACLMAVITFSAVPASATILLPNPDPPNNAIIFGDVTVYSVAFLNVNTEHDISKAKTGPYYIPAGNVTPDLAALANANGNADNSEAGTNVDDAYVQPGGTFFGTGAVADPGPSFTGDQTGTWDVSLPNLKSFVGANDLIWMFDFNEPGNAGSGLGGEDLLAWASFTLRDLDGSAPDRSFFLTADPGDTDGPTPAINSTDDPLEDGGLYDNDWVHVHGTITVDENENFKHFGTRLVTDPSNWQEVDQNLGNDRAEFAFFIAELNDLIANSPDYDMLSVDMRIARDEDGKEQLFVLAEGARIIPEPSTFIVWSVLAALGIGTACWRRRKVA